MENTLIYNYLFELPLYTKVEINENNRELLNQIFLGSRFNGEIKIDGFNPNILEKTTYMFESSTDSRDYPSFRPNDTSTPKPRELTYYESTLTCLRTNDIMRFYSVFITSKKILVKIGQYPSIADVQISKKKEFSKFLNKEQLAEYSRAVGLAANGVGIGSFVYLRRIFESLIDKKYQIAKNQKDWDDSKYLSSRMIEKIEILKDFLPKFLVEHRDLYGILSMGIHALSEEICLLNFDTIKLAIEFIILEEVEKIKKQQEIDEAKRKIELLKNNLKNLAKS